MQTQLVDCFRDTLKMCESGDLAPQTEIVKRQTKVYRENYSFASDLSGGACMVLNFDPVSSDLVSVTKGTTFDVAREYIKEGTVGVLNFANPHFPGGGVTKGAMAQEECLCRSSNLYPSLLSEEAKNEFYMYHRKSQNLLFSDRVIFTPDVTVIKTDDQVPVLMPESEWFKVSVLTCAAPYSRGETTVDDNTLKDVFVHRIINILNVALANNIEILILGAFGCGAFGNPPELVASAFNKAIKGVYMDKNSIEWYDHKFLKRIVFAIKSTTGDAQQPCPNVVAFENEFYGVSVENEKARALKTDEVSVEIKDKCRDDEHDFISLPMTGVVEVICIKCGLREGYVFAPGIKAQLIKYAGSRLDGRIIKKSESPKRGAVTSFKIDVRETGKVLENSCIEEKRAKSQQSKGGLTAKLRAIFAKLDCKSSQ